MQPEQSHPSKRAPPRTHFEFAHIQNDRSASFSCKSKLPIRVRLFSLDAMITKAFVIALITSVVRSSFARHTTILTSCDGGDALLAKWPVSELVCFLLIGSQRKVSNEQSKVCGKRSCESTCAHPVVLCAGVGVSTENGIKSKSTESKTRVKERGRERE